MTIGEIVKWGAEAHGSPPNRPVGRRLGSGGATPISVSLAGVADIKRFGGGSQSMYLSILFRDDATYRILGRKWRKQSVCRRNLDMR